MKLWKPLVFAILVTLGMNALDMLFHVATETAVHLNYVAVKFTIVFVSVFLVAWLVGIGRTPGIVTSLLGPGMFYIYYRVATPTLERSLFRIDDAVLYIVVHAIALALVYWLATRVMKKESGSLSFATLTSLAALPLHWGWIMFVIKWTGGLDGDTTKALTLNAGLIALVVLWILCYFASWISNRWIAAAGAGIVFAIASMFLGATAIGGVARVFVLGVPYLLATELKR